MPADARSEISANAAVARPALETMGSLAVDVVGLKKYFGVTRALDDCNFSASLGEIHAVVGGNGCGKSTLAKILSGVLPADSGRVTVLGRTAANPHEARDIGIATVFQEVLVADECSVVDNLFMGSDGLFSQSMSTSAKLRAATALMDELTGTHLDVEGLAGVLPLSLKQWITIGRALLRKPKVLILDESSAALDLDSTERLFAKMRQLRDEGSAILIVTHRIAELIRISDRATVLRDGKDVGVLERRDISEKNLLALMTGRSEEPKGGAAVSAEVARSDIVLAARGVRIWPDAAPTDFALHKGEIVGVAGLDGQGQSEFVRILAGVDAAHEGEPQVRVHDGGFAPIRGLVDAVERGVVYVSGDRKREGIFANLSIFENMLLPLFRTKSRAGGVIDWPSLDATFNWEAQNLQIRMGDKSNKITSLSGGNQQKVLIGRGFAMNPDIMVLNDPARGIDVGAKAELYRHLRAFAAQGKSVVYMSSELEEFIGFCSRVLVFRGGTIFDAFEAAELNPTTILESMFGQTPGLGARRPAFEGRHDAPLGTAEPAIPMPPAAAIGNPLRRRNGDRAGAVAGRDAVVSGPPPPWLTDRRPAADPTRDESAATSTSRSPVATAAGPAWRPPAKVDARMAIKIVAFDNATEDDDTHGAGRVTRPAARR